MGSASLGPRTPSWPRRGTCICSISSSWWTRHCTPGPAPRARSPRWPRLAGVALRCSEPHWHGQTPGRNRPGRRCCACSTASATFPRSRSSSSPTRAGPTGPTCASSGLAASRSTTARSTGTPGSTAATWSGNGDCSGWAGNVRLHIPGTPAQRRIRAARRRRRPGAPARPQPCPGLACPPCGIDVHLGGDGGGPAALGSAAAPLTGRRVSAGGIGHQRHADGRPDGFRDRSRLGVRRCGWRSRGPPRPQRGPPRRRRPTGSRSWRSAARR